MSTPTPTPDPILAEVQGKMDWYDRKASRSQFFYRAIKVVEILAAAAVPFAALLGAKPWVTAGLGGLIAVLEALLQLFRYHDNWISYRATAEAIRNEAFLYGARAGPFAPSPGAEPGRLLAERVAALTAQENTKWVAYSEKTVEAGGKKEDAPAQG